MRLVGPDDSKRPLTEKGVARLRRTARGLSRVVPTVGRMLSSPYPRAWQTAEILAEESDWPPPEQCPELEAGRSPADALELLAGSDGASLAVVGHEPLLSELASLLLTG
jgi:phosphohistidine phosphatase